MARRFLAIAVCLAGCGGDGAPKDTTLIAGSNGSGSAASPPSGNVNVSIHRRGGTPHHAMIDLVALSSDGTAAISRDLIGEWRVWPTLDGTKPSQRLPLPRAQDAEIAVTPTGLVVGALDAADSLELIVLDAEGTPLERHKIAPDPGIEHLALVGATAIASRADQTVVAFDAHARPLGQLPLRGARIEGLVAAGADRVLAIVRKAGATPTFEARWIQVGAKPTWGQTIALTAPVATGAVFALSSDARLLAYTTQPLPPAPAAAEAPAASAKGAPARIRKPPPMQPAANPVVSIEIFDLEKHASITPTDSTPLNVGVVLGFMGTRDLMVVDSGAGMRIAIDAEAGTTSTFGDGLPVRNGPTAFAPGVAAAGQMSSLVVVGTDGTVRYLGHRDSAPTTGALSPSGRTAAWLSTAGTLIVERLDEDTEHVIAPDSNTAFSLVELIDDATVIVLANSSVLQMFDVDSGKLLGDTPVMSAAAIQFSATTKLLLVPSGATVWIYELDRASATPFGKRMVVPEVSAFLLDPAANAGAVLIGSDGSTIRKYKLEELRAGVSRAMARDGRITLPTPLYQFDRTGKPYNLAWRNEGGVNGRYFESWPADGKTDPWNPKGTAIAKIADDVAAVIPAPDGSRFLAYDNRGTLMMYDGKGAQLWAAAMPMMANRIAWSDDGTRVLIVSAGGGEIFDAVSGASLARACGWRFMADSSPPPGAPSGVASVCTAPVRR